MRISSIQNFGIYQTNKQIQISKTQNNKQSTPCKTNIFYNPSHYTKISFGGLSKNTFTEETTLTTNFGTDLLKRIQKGENIDIIEETKEFLNQNGLTEVEIRPLTDASEADSQTVGGYRDKYTEDMQYNGGILYLAPIPKSNDKKELQWYVSVIAHELQHAIQHKETDMKSVFAKHNITDKAHIDIIMGYTSAPTIRNFASHNMQIPPLQYCVNEYQKLGIPAYEVKNIANDSKKYGTIFPSKGVRGLDNDTIFKTYGGEKAFNKKVEDSLFQTFTAYDNSPQTEPFRTPETYSALKDYYVIRLRNEAEAYQVASNINKKLNNIDNRFYTLNDLIPMAYTLVANKIEEIKI